MSSDTSTITDPVAPASDTPDAPEAQAPQQPAPKPAKAEALSPEACAQELKQRFPALFRGAPKPVKLRIQADIQERAPGVFTKPALSAFLRRHTGSTSYLIALTTATQRFDLDGQPAGDLSDEHRQAAQEELTRRRANQNARREQELQERRDRASLLRDFQNNKLTTANFCALKGIAPESLDGLLDLARKEAAEAPFAAPVRRDPRGGPGRGAPRSPGPRRDGPAEGGRPPRGPKR